MEDCYDIITSDKDKLLWKQPPVTIQMVSEFIDSLSTQYKQKIWNKYNTYQYILKDEIIHLLHLFTALYMKIMFNNHPTLNDMKQNLTPFTDIIKQNMSNKNGLNFDEFNNKLHLWILEPVSCLDKLVIITSINNKNTNYLIAAYIRNVSLHFLPLLEMIINKYIGSIYLSLCITTPMLSVFIGKTSMKIKNQIWNRYANNSEYIENTKIIPVLHSLTALYMKFNHPNVCLPSKNDVLAYLIPLANRVKKQMQNNSGMRFCEFSDKLSLWIVEERE
eukprot:56466_1